MHHVLTDGVGGLAVLTALADEGTDPIADAFPRPLPRWRSVAAATWRERVGALTKTRSGLRASRHGLRELGLGAGRPTFAARTSLNRPTGPRRRLTTIEVPLGGVLDLAHARDCTLNGVVLSGVTGPMASVLRRRGERPGELVVSVPISARREATGGELGNRTGVRPLAIPLLTDPDARLRAIADMSSGRRGASRGASAGPMGAVFRTLGALGVFQLFIDHQRLVHTFVTNIHGPESAVHFAGHRVGTVIPAAVTPGNVGVCFDVLSYAGRLVVPVVADPDIVPEQALLTDLLDEELTALIGGSAGRSSVLAPG